MARHDWQLQEKHDQDLDDGADAAFGCLAPILFAIFLGCLWVWGKLGVSYWFE